MAGSGALEAAFRGRGLAASGGIARIAIPAIEHETVALPSELVRDDGSLDLYEDVLNRFRPTYQRNRPSIQCSGWVGYIPLNDSYALEVSTRVPVGNLERLVGMAAGYTPAVLRKYSRLFSDSEDRPEALVDLLADQLLGAFDRIWSGGLLQSYGRVVNSGSTPSGRIMPFETEWKSAKVGRPTAVSTAFRRTPDFGPNRLLRHAFEKLLARYLGLSEPTQRLRTQRLRAAIARLEGVGRASPSELTTQAIAQYVTRLPYHHEAYADALLVAHLVVYDLGLSIRQAGGVAILPSILIDMALVFEAYVRRVLAEGLADDPSLEVKDGNRAGDGGAKLALYDPLAVGTNNPAVTPDIVIERDGTPVLVIDTKYKPAPRMPDRGDVNQVVVYGIRYSADRIMLLHAGRPEGRDQAEFCGEIGGFKVFNGMIDLDAVPIEDEERAFVAAVRALLP
ncbi:5-methylcytosine restriction system specificity protein McrC [Solirhodobacter olei]|uniref:5-methylcytosine restriction system specificity protein McrC n=1 Tax=Solirhodobacter olei TaxID=2493082 RepID=UPI000FD9A3E5|nr:restriction endonuclease [Solirhodobacter olei]